MGSLVEISFSICACTYFFCIELLFLWSDLNWLSVPGDQRNEWIKGRTGRMRRSKIMMLAVSQVDQPASVEGYASTLSWQFVIFVLYLLSCTVPIASRSL